MITLVHGDGVDGRPGPSVDGPPFEMALVGCGRAGASLLDTLRTGHASPRVLTADEASDLSVENPPALVVVGPELEEDSLLRLLGRLRERGSRVLFLAPRTDAELARRAMEAGADDVLPPPHSGQAILFRAAVLRARERRAPDGSREPRFGNRRLDREGRRLVDGTQPVHLSGREFELLDRLLEADGGVVEREALLRDIWGEDQHDEGVLEATVHRLRRKLEDDVSEPRFLTTVRGVGYRLEPVPAGTGQG